MDDILKLDTSKTYSYSDYLTWRFKERVEIIRGKIYAMSPAPRRIHQKISLRLTVSIYNQIEGYECELYEAPFDVRLVKAYENDKEIVNVVQPDLCVICDKTKLDDAGCLGAPDLVIEILSPNTSKKDVRIKYELYEEFGVREYWLVHTYDQLVDVFDLNEDGVYHLRRIYAPPEKVESLTVSGLTVDLNEIFENIL